MVDNTDIINKLQVLGLDEDEAKVYLDVNFYGESSVVQICKRLNIPRTTIYRICEKLVYRKFAEWVVSDNGKKIKAVKPKNLDFLIKESEAELSNLKHSLKFLQRNLQITQNVPKTEVRYYSGKEGIKQMMWNALKAKKETFGYSIFGRIEVVGKDFIEKYNKEFKLRNLRDRVVINKQQLPRLYEFVEKGSLHENTKNIRIIDNNLFYVSGDTMIYNNVYAISFWKHGEVVGVEIENPEIAKIQKGIFETLWRIGEKVQ